MNRRHFLKHGGLATAAALPLLSSPVLAGGAGSGTSASATAMRRSRGNPPNVEAGLDPFTGTLTKDLALHLLRRTGFGPRYSEASAIVNGSLTPIVDAILADQPAPADPGSWVGDQPDVTQAAQQTNRTNAVAFQRWWLNLMYSSTNPMTEKMVLFWANHFVSELAKVQIPQFIYWQNTLHRRYALGNFKDYTKAMCIDNAMVWYLDTYTSTKRNINENFARELMELFTVGPFDTTNLLDPSQAPVPNYSETDIQQAARAFTGYTMHMASGMSEYTPADFRATSADTGNDMVFLGQTGSFKYSDIVDMIFSQIDQPTGKNKVALFLCTKLYGAFVYDDPGDPTVMTQTEYHSYCNPTNPVIQAMADTFVANSFNVKAVLRQLLLSQHFFDASIVGAQLKSPVEFMISSTRQLELLGIPASDSYLLQQSNGLAGTGLSQLNQPPNVKGFPGYHSWISTTSLPSRNQITDQLLNPGVKGTVDTIALAKLVAGNDASVYNSATKLCQACAEFFLAMPITTNQVTALRNALLSDGTAESEWSTTYPNANLAIRGMLSVLLRFAEFQLA